MVVVEVRNVREIGSIPRKPILPWLNANWLNVVEVLIRKNNNDHDLMQRQWQFDKFPHYQHELILFSPLLIFIYTIFLSFLVIASKNLHNYPEIKLLNHQYAYFCYYIIIEHAIWLFLKYFILIFLCTQIQNWTSNIKNHCHAIISFYSQPLHAADYVELK